MPKEPEKPKLPPPAPPKPAPKPAPVPQDVAAFSESDDGKRKKD